ncbi:MAG: MarR family winged helix-turn-helix transcriptional regulator [Oscillospiraceae bacterium]
MEELKGYTNYLTTTWKAKKLYEAMFAQIAKRLDLKQVDIDVLIFLHNHTMFDNAKDIAKYRAISKSLVSKSVLSLVSKGYLKATANPNDKRYIHLEIEPASHKIVQELDTIQQQFLNLIYDGLTQQEAVICEIINSKINNNVENEFKKLENGVLNNGSSERK